MRENDNQNIANLKEEERERRESDLTAEANLERIQKTEEANLKDIYIEENGFSALQPVYESYLDKWNEISHNREKLYSLVWKILDAMCNEGLIVDINKKQEI